MGTRERDPGPTETGQGDLPQGPESWNKSKTETRRVVGRLGRGRRGEREQKKSMG